MLASNEMPGRYAVCENQYNLFTLVECSLIVNVDVVFRACMHFAKCNHFHSFIDSCIAIKIAYIYIYSVDVFVQVHLKFTTCLFYLMHRYCAFKSCYLQKPFYCELFF